MASLPFFATTPVNSPRIQTTIGDAITQLQSFNSVYNKYQAAVDSGSGLGGVSPEDVARWYSAAREAVINIGGKPVDYNFFFELFGGQTKETDATDLFIEYNGAIDFNIYSQSNSTGSGPGGYVDFTVSSEGYSVDGTTVNVSVGTMIYNHQDMRYLIVDSVTYIAPYNTVVRAYAIDPSYTPSVYAGMAMTINQVKTTSGYSTFEDPNVQWETPGYINKIQPWQLRKSWSTPYDLSMPYQQIMRWAIYFDPITNQEVDAYEVKVAMESRELFQMAKNSLFWAGQKFANVSTLVSAGVITNYTDKYNGFDGFIPSIMYGGGKVRPYDNTVGWDLDTDWTQIVLELDALKLAEEYLLLMGKQFNLGMQRRIQDAFKNTSGSLNMKTFDRMGNSQENIKRLGIQSWEWLGNTLHTKEVGSFSDSRYFGHGYFPSLGIMLPGYGLTDSHGNEVAPVEFWRAKGTTLNGSYRETMRDMMQINGTTEFQGDITETIQMSVNAVENIFLLLPQYPAA